MTAGSTICRASSDGAAVYARLMMRVARRLFRPWCGFVTVTVLLAVVIRAQSLEGDDTRAPARNIVSSESNASNAHGSPSPQSPPRAPSSSFPQPSVSAPSSPQVSGASVLIAEVHPALSNYYEPADARPDCLETPQPGAGDDDDAEAAEATSKRAWIKLTNQEDHEVSLEGWIVTLTAGDGKQSWLYKLLVKLPPGGSALLADVACTAEGSPGEVHAALQQLYARNGSGTGSTLALKRPDGSIASSIGPGIPRLPPGASWGLSALAGSTAQLSQTASASDLPPYTFFALPSWAPGTQRGSKSGIIQQGPSILGLDCQLQTQPLPGSDLILHAMVARNLDHVQSVYLSYQVDYKNNVSTAFTQVRTIGDAVMYQARIPSSALSSGSMVRWQAWAKDSSGRMSSAPFEEPKGSLRCGTVIGPAVSSPDVPVLEWFTPSPDQAMTISGADHGSLFFNNQFYDGVLTHRRGVTSLSHPKPKLSFKIFQYLADRPPVSRFGLQSFWFELGERSYMKEPLALKTFDLAGVMSPTSFHVHVRRNGGFFGLFGYVEDIDGTFLKRHGLSPDGPLIKAVSGELSNLRWDLPVDQMPFYYTKGNRKNQSDDWIVLKNFTNGIAGGGPEPRSKYLFDNLQLPEVINEMAAQTLVLNMDRCTKNFYVYLNPETQRWFRFPWDLDASFGQDNGLGGAPGDKYCVLACEQWNSPLYCDSEHTQDLQKMTAWGVVTVKMDDGYQARPAGRLHSRLLLDAPPPYPKPQGWDNVDRDMSHGSSVTGVLGTYNHLVDALLEVEATRGMYLRRLRTLTDQLLVSGKIAQLANETYGRIKELAKQDAALWRSGIDVHNGYLQITTEFLPRRTEQLTKQYGPDGSNPLLPSSQPADAQVYIRRVVKDPYNSSFSFVELNNPSAYAVDMSYWQLQGSWQFSFAPGTVLPVHYSMYTASSIRGFMYRASSPRGGEGLFVVGPMRASATSNDQEVRLLNSAGQVVQSCRWGSNPDSCS